MNPRNPDQRHTLAHNAALPRIASRATQSWQNVSPNAGRKSPANLSPHIIRLTCSRSVLGTLPPLRPNPPSSCHRTRYIPEWPILSPRELDRKNLHRCRAARKLFAVHGRHTMSLAAYRGWPSGSRPASSAFIDLDCLLAEIRTILQGGIITAFIGQTMPVFGHWPEKRSPFVKPISTPPGKAVYSGLTEAHPAAHPGSPPPAKGSGSIRSNNFTTASPTTSTRPTPSSASAMLRQPIAAYSGNRGRIPPVGTARNPHCSIAIPLPGADAFLSGIYKRARWGSWGP